MGSAPQNFYSTPAFELFRRALTVVAVQNFRGMNVWQTGSSSPPNIALDCLNVIVSSSGALEKFRLPKVLAAAPQVPPGPFVSGPQGFWDFQYYKGGVTPVRQILANFQNNLYFYNWQADGTLLINFIETNAGDFGPWSTVEVNNELFMANNVRMLQWTGTNLWNWGIAAPPNAPLITGGIATAGIAVAPGGISIVNGIATVNLTGNFNFIAGDIITFTGTTIGALNAAGNITVKQNNGLNSFTFATALPNQTGGGGNVVPQGTGVPVTGWSWAYAYENSVTGHVSSRSPISVLSNLGNIIAIVQATASADPQVDTIVWYRTLDGGGNWFRVPNPNNGGLDWPIAQGGLGLRDQFLDGQLDKTTQGSLINNPPPVGKYIVKYQGRIFIANLVGFPQTFVWSGYEQILTGRPEQSYPPNNKINLALGAEAIQGMGSLQSGVVFFSSSGSMWMLRGAIEDITLAVPVQFTDYLVELPWTLGCLNHFSIANTPLGIVWLAGDKTVQYFDGANQPVDISEAVYPLLRRITPGAEGNCVGSYFNWLERDWYSLLVPIDGSINPNLILFFSLNRDTSQIDVFPCNIPADFIGVVQTPQGQRQLLISSVGRMLNLPVQSVTIAGVAIPITMNNLPPNLLPAYWQSGYFGNDTPYRSKMFRFGALETDNQGFGAELRFVDGNDRTFRTPEIVELEQLDSNYIEMNNRAQRVSVKVMFPDADLDCTLMELRVAYIGTSDRQS